MTIIEPRSPLFGATGNRRKISPKKPRLTARQVAAAKRNTSARLIPPVILLAKLKTLLPKGKKGQEMQKIVAALEKFFQRPSLSRGSFSASSHPVSIPHQSSSYRGGGGGGVSSFGQSDDDRAYREHSNRQASAELAEELRRLDRGYDARPMSDDDRAYHEDAVRQALDKFQQATRPTSEGPNDWR